MIKFLKREKSRNDFGVMFDRFIEKDWSRGYFKNESYVDQCLGIIKKNIKEIDGNCYDVVELKDLFLDKKFVESSYCNELLESFAKGLFILPVDSIEWYLNNDLIGENYIWSEIYESEHLPYYFILNCGNASWPLLLVNKSSGSIVDVLVSELLPSNKLNILFGRFNNLDLNSEKYYQLTFTSDNFGKIIEESNCYKLIEDIILLPNEFSSYLYLGFSSPIYPYGTNINFDIQTLSDREDINFRNKLIEIMNIQGQNETSELPF